MKRIVILALALSLATPLFAGKVSGLVEEFNKVEEYNKNRKLSDSVKKATLEKNLLSALKYSLHRKYLDYKEYTKDLKADSIQYEPQKGTFGVYVKYKTYIVFYSYLMDPEIYLQTPINEVFYVRPENLEEEPHKDEKPAVPATGK
ncbi:hypothetical protein EHQ27_12395 [Leptospira wolffii]|uniref:LIC11625 family surface-exposed protein n=1 Tax=Leptospira wolffii TaxID=409998 RepID=UPI0010846234|nr:hypothetical protein [Leptospira wolffii]TGK59994.1 hypothetical protein EHQ32_08770 [Leptospira wolffii]TGK70016.1 hypothetical protein EHQ27_12395 [Leptospira wolffii]TGK76002.1 hypothetical protein EHQ35_01520 [Leptospira wolffii]TGL30253.1 hypothetical protein EHQ57_07490 [Leptospira wolffii]